VPVRELAFGDPVPLPQGVTLYLDVGGSGGDTPRTVRVGASKDGTLHQRSLFDFVAAYKASDLPRPERFGITSWTGDKEE
jgi:hypothetical protein